jgi:hypothetical protein
MLRCWQSYPQAFLHRSNFNTPTADESDTRTSRRIARPATLSVSEDPLRRLPQNGQAASDPTPLMNDRQEAAFQATNRPPAEYVQEKWK